jgi:hypothetical protein
VRYWVSDPLLATENLTNDLEALLVVTKELQPKESIKELEKHLARHKMEFKGRSRMCQNPRTGQPTSIPGHVTQEEQRIIHQISWEITSWRQTTKQVAEKPSLPNKK